ncbi:MAG: MFS transporter [Candidatus Omnitrophica bacterium]|nr:MFS transporter [Candidatus Omnitrophota bacterium]MBU4303330.1 MFS transporter [Candidatus Omnitrophota bacterium]MBU4418268.1 MFS transporter [Candidatus Omnitrophota bacterium]MBU4468341.1 MFS transporter [Candidatus Omnitrophota bacterium]MCG2708015.1 MFS transporter [Candidatus Omnitrophota bacterium]
MFSSLKVKYFRIYWLGMFVSLVGTWIQTVAQSWLVFQLTNSAFLLGVVGFLGSIPIFILSLFGGVLADRINKRNILIFTQAAFMLLAFLLAVLTQFRFITPAQIMFIALLNGVIMAFDAPARQSIVVELVGREHLFNAIALNSVAFNSSRIIGPAIAGVLISVIGMSGCFYLNGISFLAVIIALFYIKFGKSTVRNGNSAFKDIKEGLVFVSGNRLILALMSVVAAMSLFGVSYIILMPVFASHVLGVGVKGLGVLMSSTGIGALAGALGLAKLGDFKFKGKLLIWSVFLFSVSLVTFSLSKNYLVSVFTLIFVGGCSVIPIALVNTLLQVNVPDEFRGRVMSLFMITFAGVVPFGNLISGTLAQSWGVSAALFFCGLVCLVLFTLINFLFPGLKKL